MSDKKFVLVFIVASACGLAWAYNFEAAVVSFLTASILFARNSPNA